ncbi:hypothetical protein N2152v2_005289 [Parachlorella kessleri]
MVDSDRYDWTQLTTVAWNDDPDLTCKAHSAGARVVLDGRGANSPSVYGNRTARRAWLAGQVRLALDGNLDGVNFDMEDPLAVGDPLAAEYSALVAEAAEAFHRAIPGSQVSVDIPWSPHGIDGRNFDWAGLAKAADLLFVMAYDTQSQIWGRCVASANAPQALVRRGLQQWLDLGVPARKLVLGLPWYGYRYPCANQAFADGLDDVCELPPVSFQGCPCSDAAGRQFCFSDIQRSIRRGASVAAGGRAAFNSNNSHSSSGMIGGLLLGSASGPGGGLEAVLAGAEDAWFCEPPKEDPVQGSPYTRCFASGDPGRSMYQVWFDNPQSLERLYALAAEFRLRGVGMWNLDCLDYRCKDGACKDDTDAIAVAATPHKLVL